MPEGVELKFRLAAEAVNRRRGEIRARLPLERDRLLLGLPDAPDVADDVVVVVEEETLAMAAGIRDVGLGDRS